MTIRPLLASAPLALLIAVSSQTAQADCVSVEVHNVRPGQGSLMVAVYAYADADSHGK